MKVTYDPEMDALFVRLTDAAIIESEELRPGIVFDFDESGRVVAFEILRTKENLAGTVDAALIPA